MEDSPAPTWEIQKILLTHGSGLAQPQPCVHSRIKSVDLNLFPYLCVYVCVHVFLSIIPSKKSSKNNFKPNLKGKSYKQENANSKYIDYLF